jgi:oligoendopeptidase F
MKRVLSLLLILALCAGLLAGCGQKASPAQDDPTPSAEPSQEAEAVNAPVNAGQSDETGTAPDADPGEPAEPEAEHESPFGEGKAYLERNGMWELIPFDEMPYERPTLDELSAAIDAVGEALDAGEPYETVEALLDACDDAYSAFYTMYSISFIRSCQDMTDDFYADEYAWMDEKSADVSQLVENLYFRCGMSDMAQELEEKYFWPGFVEQYSDPDNAFYDDEMVALLQEESNLIAEYRALVASPTVVLADGTEVDYFTSLDEFQGFEYLDLLIRYYDQYNPQLADIYIRLVKNRQQQAVQAGYGSYEELAFDHNFERDYTPELAEDYLADIAQHIVPLFLEVRQKGAGYLDPSPLDADRLQEILRVGVSGMGDEVLDTYEFMVEHRLCDISYSPLKAEMSFQTYLDAYEVPYLFMDSSGTLSDITTFSHEFGHYLDGFLNYDADETIDLAECFSQSMELLMLTRLDESLSARELSDLYKIKMGDILNMYVQQASFAEFEHIVYAAAPEELTVDFVNQTFLDMTKKYGYCEDGFEFLYALFWTDITHFFEQPFYIITYPVSHDIAMQVFQLEQANEGAGLEKFLEMLPREYPDMLDTALNAGLESPFDPGRIEKVAATMREILLG